MRVIEAEAERQEEEGEERQRDEGVAKQALQTEELAQHTHLAGARVGPRTYIISDQTRRGGGLDLRMLSVASQVETTTTPRTATGTAGATRD